MLELAVAQGASHLVEKGLAIDQLGEGVVVAGKAQGFLHMLQRMVHAFVDH